MLQQLSIELCLSIMLLTLSMYEHNNLHIMTNIFNFCHMAEVVTYSLSPTRFIWLTVMYWFQDDEGSVDFADLY